MTESNVQSNVSVTFRHTEPTDALKKYASEKISACLDKFQLQDLDTSVVLSVEKRDHAAEVVLQSGGYDIVLKSVTGDLYSAIDKLADIFVAQLRKQKEKFTDRHHSAEL